MQTEIRKLAEHVLQAVGSVLSPHTPWGELESERRYVLCDGVERALADCITDIRNDLWEEVEADIRLQHEKEFGTLLECEVTCLFSSDPVNCENPDSRCLFCKFPAMQLEGYGCGESPHGQHQYNYPES